MLGGGDLSQVVGSFGDNPFFVAGQALREEPLSQLALTAPLSGEPRELLVTIYVAGNLCLP